MKKFTLFQNLKNKRKRKIIKLCQCFFENLSMFVSIIETKKRFIPENIFYFILFFLCAIEIIWSALSIRVLEIVLQFDLKNLEQGQSSVTCKICFHKCGAMLEFFVFSPPPSPEICAAKGRLCVSVDVLLHQIEHFCKLNFYILLRKLNVFYNSIEGFSIILHN